MRFASNKADGIIIAFSSKQAAAKKLKNKK
jgi:hypothetical protein